PRALLVPGRPGRGDLTAAARGGPRRAARAAADARGLGARLLHRPHRARAGRRRGGIDRRRRRPAQGGPRAARRRMGAARVAAAGHPGRAGTGRSLRVPARGAQLPRRRGPGAGRSRAGQPRSRDGVGGRRRCRRAASRRRFVRLRRLPRVALELPPPGAAARRGALLLGSPAARQLSLVVYGAGRGRRRVRGPAAARARAVRPRRARHGRGVRADRGGAVIGARPKGAARLRAAAVLAAAAALGAAALVGATLAALEPLPASLDAVVAESLDLAGREASQGDDRRQVLDRHALPLSRTFTTDWNVYDRVALHDVPRFLRDAFVAAEDRRFYEHGGVDWRARLAAVVANVRHGA